MSLDRCDLLIIGKYFNCITDFTNLIKVCHKFEHLLEMYHYNPVSFQFNDRQNTFSNINSYYIYDNMDFNGDFSNFHGNVYITSSFFIKPYLIPKQHIRELNTRILNPKCKKILKIVEKFEEYNTISKPITLNFIELKCVSVPYGVTKIPSHAFENTKLIKIVLPNTIICVCKCAFQFCNQMKKIKLPDSITIIKKYAFANCSNLHDVNIPKSLIHLHSFAFCNTKLKSEIVLPNGLKYIGKYAFTRFNCSNNLLILPNNLECIKDFTFFNANHYLKHIVLPYGVKYIGKYAFCENYNLESINLPNSVISIGESAFESCISLKCIKLPIKLHELKKSTFMNCQSLCTVISTQNLNYVCENVFSNCHSLDDSLLIKHLKKLNEHIIIDDKAFKIEPLLTIMYF